MDFSTTPMTNWSGQSGMRTANYRSRPGHAHSELSQPTWAWTQRIIAADLGMGTANHRQRSIGSSANGVSAQIDVSMRSMSDQPHITWVQRMVVVPQSNGITPYIS